MDDKEYLGIEARKYEALQNLTLQDGWPILLEHLNRVKQVVVEALLTEKDYNKILTLQERVRAFSSVISTIDSAKNIKEKLYKDIQDIVEDDKLRKEFDI